MEHSKHIWRISLLLILLLVVVVLGRHFLIPESFGKAGYYRYNALVELTSKAPRHGGDEACAECHDEKAEAKLTGKHQFVRCEVCHAPLSTHIQDEEVIAEMRINRSYELCSYCHRQLTARDGALAQIDLLEHLELESDHDIPAEACLECHDSDNIHSP